MNRSLQLLNKIARNRPLQHGLFWVFSFYLLARLFAYSDELAKVDLIYTFLFHLPLLLAVYVNLRWLIPRYLRSKKYIAYSLLLVVLMFLNAGFNLLIFNYLCDYLFPGYYFIAYYGYWELMEFVAAYIGITTLIKLSKGWFRYLETKDQLQRLEAEKNSAELSALKSQVNPHFLFNSLNNLYSLALDHDERTPGIILRLSQTMRYLLYESNADFVPLSKEVEHLQNFVEMQRLRVGEKAEILFEVQGDMRDQRIAPLLFLPLVENGFKHGIKGETQGAFIRILLQIGEGQLIFKTENNKGHVDEVVKDYPSGGVGLENLRRRLLLLYPGKHQLDIVDGVTVFTVVLTIQF